MRALTVFVVVILTAGVLAARAVGSSSVAAGGPVNAAALGLQTVPSDTARSTTVAAPTTIISSARLSSTVVPTTTVGRTRATPMSTAPSTAAIAPTSTSSTSTTSSTLPPKSSWSAESRDLKVTMTIEPASPKPGEQITVVATMSADTRCCEAAITFNDGEVGRVLPTLVEPPDCMTVESVTPRTIRAVKTHTYQASGRQLVTLYVVSWPCIDRNLFPGSIGPPDIRSVGLDACIEVQGPRSPMLPPCPR